MKYGRLLVALLVVAVALPSSAGVRRCSPNTSEHSPERHADPKGHTVFCPPPVLDKVEVSKIGGLGQMDVHGRS